MVMCLLMELWELRISQAHKWLWDRVIYECYVIKQGVNFIFGQPMYGAIRHTIRNLSL